MTLNEVMRIRDRTLIDLRGATSQLIGGKDDDSYRLLVRFAGQEQMIESEDQLDQWLSRFGIGVTG